MCYVACLNQMFADNVVFYKKVVWGQRLKFLEIYTDITVNNNKYSSYVVLFNCGRPASRSLSPAILVNIFSYSMTVKSISINYYMTPLLNLTDRNIIVLKIVTVAFYQPLEFDSFGNLKDF